MDWPPSDRATAVAWARRLLDDEATVFLDTETTGLGGQAEIVDLAVVAANGLVLIDTLVRPRRPIPFEATLIHGIDDDDVFDAPTWDHVAPRLRALIVDRPVVVYNAPFDRGMIEQCCRASLAGEIRAEWHCAMRAYAAYRGERARGKSGFRWHRLEEAATACGTRLGSHRARADAEACRAIVRAMAGVARLR